MQRGIVIKQKIFVPYRVNGQGFKKPFTFSANEKEVTILEIQFRYVTCMVVTRLCKYFGQLFIPIQVIQGNYGVLMQVNNPNGEVFERVYTV